MTGRTTRRAAGAVLAVAVGCGVALCAQSALSSAQLAVIAKKTAKMSATEKQMVDGWPVGKKLAEFFCSEAGVAEIARRHKGANRLFLGPDDEGVKRFVVTGNTKVAGDGSVRIGADWKDLTFECTLDAEKAAVKSFTYTLK